MARASSTRKSRVKVQAMLTVVSSSPVEPGKAHPLTPLDHTMALHTLHAVYYYKEAMEFDQLRTSLSPLLCLYPTMTGRLSREKQKRTDDSEPDDQVKQPGGEGEGEGDWRVRFTDAGVRVLMSKVGATIDEWLRTADLEEEMDLTVMDDFPQDPQIWSPFRIQINEFECGGLAIGVSCTHLLADPTSIAFFFKSWTESHRGEPIAHPPFVSYPSPLHRRNIQIPSPSPSPSPSPPPPPPPPPHDHDQSHPRCCSCKLATATFGFSDESVRQLLSKIRRPDCSPFDILSALFWTRIILSRNNNNNNHKEIVNEDEDREGNIIRSSSGLSICVDFRNRLSTPLPYGYFGNAMFFTNLTLDLDKLESGEGQLAVSELGNVADAIRTHVAGLKEDEFWAWLEARKYKQPDKQPFKMYGPQLTCINMEQLITTPAAAEGQRPKQQQGSTLYASAFKEGGPPVHVSYNVGNISGGEGLVFVMPSPEGGMARRIKVVLEEALLAKLCEDQLIRNLHPAMIIPESR